MKGDVSIWHLGSRGETEAAGGMVPIAMYSRGLMPCSLLGSLASVFSPPHQDTHRTHLPGLGHKAADAADEGQSGQNTRHSHRKQGQEVHDPVLNSWLQPGHLTRASIGLSLGFSAHLRDEETLRYLASA